jgi:hypothetical protein
MCLYEHAVGKLGACNLYLCENEKRRIQFYTCE